MPMQVAGAQIDETVETHAEFRGADLLRIGRADRRDRRRRLKPGLQEADAAVVLDAVERHRLRWQAEQREDVGRKLPLESQIMHGHDGRQRGSRAVAHVGQRHRGLPVMRMDKGWRIARNDAGGDIGAGAAQRCEAPRIVWPIGARGVAVWSADTVEQMRRVENEKVEPGNLDGQDRRLAAMQVGILVDGLLLASTGRAPRDSRAKACAHERPALPAPAAALRRHRPGRRS